MVSYLYRHFAATTYCNNVEEEQIRKWSYSFWHMQYCSILRTYCRGSKDIVWARYRTRIPLPHVCLVPHIFDSCSVRYINLVRGLLRCLHFQQEQQAVVAFKSCLLLRTYSLPTVCYSSLSLLPSFNEAIHTTVLLYNNTLLCRRVFLYRVLHRIRCTFRFTRKNIVPTLGLWFKARVRLSKVSF